MILVHSLRESGGYAGIPEQARYRHHLVLRVATDGNRALAAVEVVRPESKVGLRLAEVGQYVDECPFGASQFGPLVVVLGYPPEEDLPVD